MWQRLAPVPALLAAAALVGCGHKATQNECEFLVDKTVELTMREMWSDASVQDISDAQAKQRKQLEGDVKDCEGRRVTDGMMKCAHAAQSSDELAACVK